MSNRGIFNEFSHARIPSTRRAAFRELCHVDVWRQYITGESHCDDTGTKWIERLASQDGIDGNIILNEYSGLEPRSGIKYPKRYSVLRGLAYALKCVCILRRCYQIEERSDRKHESELPDAWHALLTSLQSFTEFEGFKDVLYKADDNAVAVHCTATKQLDHWAGYLRGYAANLKIGLREEQNQQFEQALHAIRQLSGPNTEGADREVEFDLFVELDKRMETCSGSIACIPGAIAPRFLNAFDLGLTDRDNNYDKAISHACHAARRYLAAYTTEDYGICFGQAIPSTAYEKPLFYQSGESAGAAIAVAICLCVLGKEPLFEKTNDQGKQSGGYVVAARIQEDGTFAELGKEAIKRKARHAARNGYEVMVVSPREVAAACEAVATFVRDQPRKTDLRREAELKVVPAENLAEAVQLLTDQVGYLKVLLEKALGNAEVKDDRQGVRLVLDVAVNMLCETNQKVHRATLDTLDEMCRTGVQASTILSVLMKIAIQKNESPHKQNAFDRACVVVYAAVERFALRASTLELTPQRRETPLDTGLFLRPTAAVKLLKLYQASDEQTFFYSLETLIKMNAMNPTLPEGV